MKKEVKKEVKTSKEGSEDIQRKEVKTSKQGSEDIHDLRIQKGSEDIHDLRIQMRKLPEIVLAFFSDMGDFSLRQPDYQHELF